MTPSAWAHLASLATVLALALPATAAPVAPVDLPALGGQCDGLVDVDCDDYNGETFVRHCLVWHLYLDIAMPPVLAKLGICQDNPYDP